ncbi:unnamed protein product [Effrenium voratum]|nr:unnamed protein product [Effrenium voratum]
MTEGAGALRRQLRASSLRGTAGQLLRLALGLQKLRCCFAQDAAWDGQVEEIDTKALVRLRRRFPEAQIFLWQSAFPENFLQQLQQPLAFVEARPPAVIQIGSVSLTFHLRLFTVSDDSFFDKQHPHRRLLLKLDMSVQQGGILYPGGAPGPPESSRLCGEGHRWACACRHAEESAELPFFCSLRECFLRPAWRAARVLLHKERPLLHRCHEVNGEVLQLTAPLRLALCVYRADDDEGPDEPEDL